MDNLKRFALLGLNYVAPYSHIYCHTLIHIVIHSYTYQHLHIAYQHILAYIQTCCHPFIHVAIHSYMLPTILTSCYHPIIAIHPCIHVAMHSYILPCIHTYLPSIHTYCHTFIHICHAIIHISLQFLVYSNFKFFLLRCCFRSAGEKSYKIKIQKLLLK